MGVFLEAYQGHLVFYKKENKTFWLLFCVWCILFCWLLSAGSELQHFAVLNAWISSDGKHEKEEFFSTSALLFFCVCPHFKYPYTMYYRIFVKEFYFYLKRTAAAAARLKGKKRIKRTYPPKKKDNGGSDVEWNPMGRINITPAFLSLCLSWLLLSKAWAIAIQNPRPAIATR